MAKPSVADGPDDQPEGLTSFESKLVNLLALLLILSRFPIFKREKFLVMLLSSKTTIPVTHLDAIDADSTSITDSIDAVVPIQCRADFTIGRSNQIKLGV